MKNGDGQMRRKTPRVVHLVWINKADLPAEARVTAEAGLKPAFRDNVAEWRRQHPSYEVRLWFDADVDALMRSRPEWKEQLDKFENIGARADVARYAILDEHGGVYADMDTRPLKSIEPILAELDADEGAEDVVVGSSVPMAARPIKSNYFIVARKPGAELWRHVLEHLRKQSGRRAAQGRGLRKSRGEGLGVLGMTGPAMMNKMPCVGRLRDEHTGSHCSYCELTTGRCDTRQVSVLHSYDGTWAESMSGCRDWWCRNADVAWLAGMCVMVSVCLVALVVALRARVRPGAEPPQGRAGVVRKVLGLVLVMTALVGLLVVPALPAVHLSRFEGRSYFCKIADGPDLIALISGSVFVLGAGLVGARGRSAGRSVFLASAAVLALWSTKRLSTCAST